mmetsp:Transcript_64299/g.199084  ORF Transcript_64299/g.199084 Transcript_64299/m.199084 type:complete len:578 (-) Transcript_64299:13-1746(-)
MEDAPRVGADWSGAGGLSLAEGPADGAPALTPLWAVYLAASALGLAAQVLSAGGFAAAAAVAWRRYWRRSSGKHGAEPSGVAVVEEPIAVVVPCYLPNEASIIRETLEHLLYRLTSVERLDVHLVYNTPRELPVEAELRQLAAGVLPEGRRLFVEQVPGSTSKAENLNHAVPRIAAARYVAIYDADHMPDPDSLALAVAHLKASGVDCVQGSTYIRAGCCLARGLVQAEFFVTYFVMLPMTEALTGTGFFGGSNGVWLASSLAGLRFDERALTEDIDCFLRAALGHGLTFSFLPESCSGELLPSGLLAFWRQRLRWSMGWDQATLRHGGLIWGSRLSLRKRLGLYYIFVFRWLSLLIVVFVAVFNTFASLQHVAAEHVGVWDHHHRVPSCIRGVQLCSGGLYGVLVAWSLLRALLHRPGLSLPCSVLLYFLIMPAYLILNTSLSVVSLVRLASGNTGKWVVTRRYRAAPEEAVSEALGKEEPLLPAEPLLPLSWLLLASGLLTLGALVGSVVGYAFAQRTVTYPLWGWVPFGIFAKTITYTDGRVVAEGMAAGLAASAALLLASCALAACRRSRLWG